MNYTSNWRRFIMHIQEERLITSGKFKDLQRANIKAAASMMITNYRLNDCVTEVRSHDEEGFHKNESHAS